MNGVTMNNVQNAANMYVMDVYVNGRAVGSIITKVYIIETSNASAPT